MTSELWFIAMRGIEPSKLHLIQFLQFIIRAYEARLKDDAEKAEQAFDQAADHLRRTEPRYSTYIDTMLALRFVARARQQK